MTRWIESTKDPAWHALFRNFRSSAFRLEGQQVYSNPAEDAALVRHLTGGSSTSFEPVRRLESTRSSMADGRRKTTVRIVVEPPTLYTAFELTVYPSMVAAGEDVRILAVGQGRRPADLPPHDFWLFDDREVWRMHYFENFRFAGAALLDDDESVARHVRWRDAALARSLPLQDYLADRAAEGSGSPR